jgi:hypothetical protein
MGVTRKPVLAYVGHLSRREIAILQAFDARIHELREAGELLDWHADGLPILMVSVVSHYKTAKGAKKAFCRLADFIHQMDQLSRAERCANG